MNIQAKHSIQYLKVKDLEMMHAYLVYDEETHSNAIVIRSIDDAIIIQNASNCPELCMLRMKLDADISVIGQITNFNIIDVELQEVVKRRGG